MLKSDPFHIPLIMTSLMLDYSRENAKTMIKVAFEKTRGIKQYNDDGVRIIGKSGMRLASHGEQVIVEIPENQPSDVETMISVEAKKEVSINVTANPEKYKSRFLEQLNEIRGEAIEDVLERLGEKNPPVATKEVASSDELRDGSSSIIIAMIIIAIVFLIFMIVMAAAITP